jgi:hypothetical protein
MPGTAASTLPFALAVALPAAALAFAAATPVALWASS